MPATRLKDEEKDTGLLKMKNRIEGYVKSQATSTLGEKQ